MEIKTFTSPLIWCKSNDGNYPLPIIPLGLLLFCFFLECSNYQFLNDCSRAVTYQRVFFNCNDTTKLLGWYRFGGEAGTQMADSCVTMRHCGARDPGWLSGGHPSVSDGAVLRKVCFTGYSGCCRHSTFVSVRNCSGFYVYKLSPVYPYNNCDFRYCSSYGFELPTTSITGDKYRLLRIKI